MTEEKTKPATEKKITPVKVKPLPVTEGINAKPQNEKLEDKMAEQSAASLKTEAQTKPTKTPSTVDQESSDNKSPKKEKKKEESKLTKKEEAIAKGQALHISKKQAMYICEFIKNKPIDKAIADLEQVIKLKKPVPFKGEIPHRKGKGIMSGRFPVKASKLFINMLKSLKGNVTVNQMELEKSKITFASASWASRPARKGNTRGKRTNVILKAEEVKPNKEKKK